MSSFAAARSVLRSAAGRTALGSRLTAGSRSKPPSSPLRIPKQNQNRLSRPTFKRSAEEMSRCTSSLLPYHTATASALLTSMLSLSRPTSCSTPDGISLNSLPASPQISVFVLSWDELVRKEVSDNPLHEDGRWETREYEKRKQFVLTDCVQSSM
ncbi:hypothetical protein TIFTF001_019897 [Ficus carica]|uniref:Protein NUCLEAR FUSION DEFECTIVE 6, chloroplastic/mitochondrial-like n=1 Tax=Ficus carica TaxID=3494 RepID=A0AA88AR20_FICCA|nr:hypothetical protein TIFTF001_019897 [Ficus carica]